MTERQLIALAVVLGMILLTVLTVVKFRQESSRERLRRLDREAWDRSSKRAADREK